MRPKNKRYRFTPELWQKWMECQNTPHPHTAVLQAGIEQLRKSLEVRIQTTVSINAVVAVDEIRAVLEKLN